MTALILESLWAGEWRLRGPEPAAQLHKPVMKKQKDLVIFIQSFY